MPTISQLPSASSISAADEVPISQAGIARAVSVGTLLASTQPAITVDSLSLLGRTSLGSGGPEQVNVGMGVSLSGGTLVANGLDHSAFPLLSEFSVESDLVISNQGNPMLMQASLLRGLFSAGQNVGIDTNGVISATAGAIETGSSIGALQVLTELSSQDLVAVSHSGSNCAITYGNFLDGMTIDEAQPAAAAGDSDTTWVAQGSNVMVSQTFGAIWAWVANKLPTYKAPITEISANTNLDAALHNGRLLVCSQPIILTPLTSNMGSGFQCTVINASIGNVTLGAGFISSSGSLALTPWQSATLTCAAYSAGTIAFAAMPTTAVALESPGQVVGLSAASPTPTTITLSWQTPTSGGVVSSYSVVYRLTGTTSWTGSALVVSATTYQLVALQPATSYDVEVQAQNSAGTGAASAVLTVVTSGATQTALPSQVSGLVASAISSNTIQLSWSVQTGSTAATSFTIQYRLTGSSGWTSSISGISGTGTSVTALQPSTSYDFEAIGINAAGQGPTSSIVTAVTLAASQAVSSITWNLLPVGPYTHGSGAIGINAQIFPAASPVQFGFSPSASIAPTTWTAAVLVNSSLWGAYVPTPATVGSWYVWAEGLDGSARTTAPNAFLVQ